MKAVAIRAGLHYLAMHTERRGSMLQLLSNITGRVSHSIILKLVRRGRYLGKASINGEIFM